MSVQSEAQDLPLTGIRAIDLGRRLAGPVCATHLADFGAEVIKVELPNDGDPRRRTRPMEHINGVNPDFAVDNRNKKTITLDLHAPKGQDLLKRLVAVSDVLIENFRPGTLERWNLGYDVLSQANPRIIVARISAYGQSGPYRERAGEATTTAAFAGHVFTNGTPNGPPLRLGMAYGDHLGALFALYGIMLALWTRQRTGRGQVIDVALYESLFRITGSLVGAYAAHGIVRQRRGNSDAVNPSVGMFLSADNQWIAVDAGDDRHYARWMERMGRQDLLLHKTMRQRVGHAGEIRKAMEEWFAARPAREAADTLQGLGIPSDVVNSAAEIFEEPHFRARNAIVAMDIKGTPLYMPGLQPHLSDTPGRIQERYSQDLGQHNEHVYGHVLGLSNAELEALKAENVI